jgi:hypothetical protein
MTTLNHLKKDESLANKQLVLINSDERDDLTQNTSSFTYTFNTPIKRVSKIDVIYSKIPKTFYNLNNDNANMSITTETFNEIKTESLIINDSEISSDVIQSTNVVDGTIVKTNISSGTDDIAYTSIKTRNTFIYTSGTYKNDSVDFNNFTGASANLPLTNMGLTDLFVCKYSLEQELLMRFRISGILDDGQIDIDVNDTHIYVTGISRSSPVIFYNADDSVARTIISDGLPTTFVAQYTISGTNIWALKMFGTAVETLPSKIIYTPIPAINPNNDTEYIYVSGTYNRNVHVFDISENELVTFSHSDGIFNPNVFIAQFGLDGSFNWISKIEGICFLTALVLNPNNNNITLGLSFNEELVLFGTHAGGFVTIPTDNLLLDGTTNCAIIEYTSAGAVANRLKIGGTAVDDNIQLDIIGTTLAITGSFTSNPLRFYGDDDNLQHIMEINGSVSNIFIAKYDLIPVSKTLVWSTNIYDETDSTSVSRVSLSNDLEFLICGIYSSLCKFYNPGNIYQIGKDLLNTNGVNYTFMAKYNTDGSFQQRSQIEAVAAGAINVSSIDARSNNVFISGSNKGDAKLFNSYNSNANDDKTLSNNLLKTNGFIASYINNNNNFSINRTTLSKRIICRTLNATNLNFTMNINAFSQQLGLKTSQKFQAIIFGTPVEWDLLNITDANNTLSITFNLGNSLSKVFDIKNKSFKITNATTPGYSPYALASELSNIIKKTLLVGDIITYTQTTDPVVFDNVKKIFYIQLLIDGTFTVDVSPLIGVNGMKLPITISPHCVITDIDSTANSIAINDNSKLTIKTKENTIVSKFNNVDFTTAFPNISSNSGVLKINATLNRNVSARVGKLSDNISSDLKVNDEITFNTPWIKLDRNENNFIDAIKWKAISISGDGSKQTAIAIGSRIYISIDTGNTWIIKESKRKWEDVSVSESAEFQTAVVDGGKIYISSNFGNSWTPKDSDRSWKAVAISRKSNGGLVSEGKYQTAVAYDSRIFISSDAGKSWLAKDSIRTWQDIAMSQFGDIQTAVVYGGFIYKSINNGVDWTAVTTVKRDWQSVSMINDGTIQVAITKIGDVYKSIDSGATWGGSVIVAAGKLLTSVVISPANSNIIVVVGNTGDIYSSNDQGVTTPWINYGYQESWTSVASSEDGSLHTAVVEKGGIYEGTLNGTKWTDIIGYKPWGFITMTSDGVTQYASTENQELYKSVNSGNTWTKLAVTSFVGIKVSSDGKYVIAPIGNTNTVLVSRDFGLTFSTITVSALIAGVVYGPGISVTGKYMSVGAAGGSVYSSDDFGVTWRISGNAPFAALTHDWKSMAISSGGLIQIAVSGNDSYITYDAWVTSAISFNQGDNFNDCDISSTGQYISMCGSNRTLIISNDFGVTWRSEPIRNWVSVKMSSTGKIQIAAIGDGNIYISTDFGITFVIKDITRGWRHLALSSDGTKQAAVVNGGNIYESNNTGDTWDIRHLVYSNPFKALQILAIGLSDTGQYISYAGFGNYIYTSNNYGKSFTKKHYIKYYLDMLIASNGLKQVALGGSLAGTPAATQNGVETSSDGGLTWTTTPAAPQEQWSRGAITPDGNVVTIVGINVDIYSSTGGANYVIDAGSIVSRWKDVCTSTDGSVKYAASETDGVWKFTTAGGWIKVLGLPGAPTRSSMIQCIDSVANDGAIVLVEINGRLYFSTNGLATVSGPRGPTGLFIGRIRMSNDGNKQLLITNNRLYISTDNFVTFSIRNSERNWRSIDMTSDGSQQIASVQPGHIYQSFDSGNSWGAQQSDRFPVSVSISLDGTKQTIVSSGREIYRSNTTGNSWVTSGISNSWRQIAISKTDGSVQVAIPYNGKIYISTDEGLNWTERDAVRNWRDISVSEDGTTMSAVDFGGNIYTSVNTGTAWTERDIDRNWISISIGSNLPATQTALVQNGSIYRSVDTGVNWNIVASTGPFDWKQVSLSYNGEIQTAVMSGGPIYRSIDYGATWVTRDSARSWSSIAISGTGNFQIASVFSGQLYVSTNWGDNWTPREQDRNWVSVDLNINGTIMIAVDENKNVYQSNDTGVTWRVQNSLKEIVSIAMSADGITQTAAETYGNIYFSNNSGTEWVQSSENRNWRSITMSNTGADHTAVTYGGSIYRATIVGGILTWVVVAATGNRNYTAVAMRSDAVIQAAVVDGGNIYTSVDTGANWAERDSDRNWTGVAISEVLTGPVTHMTAVARGSKIFTSVDTGLNWIEVTTTSALNWSDVAMSNDGTIRTAVAQGGQIYVLNTAVSTLWVARDSIRNWVKVDMSGDGVNQIAIVDGGQIYSSINSGLTWEASESNQCWRGIAITDDASMQLASDCNRLISHNFALNTQLVFNIGSITTGQTTLDNIITKEATTTALSVLHNFNLANADNFTIKQKENINAIDLFIPVADYTPQTLVTKINELITASNALYTNAFVYDTSTKKISYTPLFSGTGNIITSSLLKRMGFSNLSGTSVLSAGVPVVAANAFNTDVSGPLNVFIKSDIIGNLRKNKTIYSTNSKLENIIAPLDLNTSTNTFNIPISTELFLSQKSTISSIDIQISDENGDIINLNGAPIQVDFYFYSS